MSTKNARTNLPPFCPRCDEQGDVWHAVSRAVEQIFRGERVNVTAPVTECKHCGFRLLTDAQTDLLVRLTADGYRKAHGLLTGREIAMRRKAMGMTQHEFAEWVGVGTASVKRWELTLVQDKASDLLLRQRTDQTLCFMEGDYQLTEPRMDDLVCQCAAGFSELMKKRWTPTAHGTQTEVAGVYEREDFYAFAATA